MIVTTTPSVEGRRLSRYCGVVAGEAGSVYAHHVLYCVVNNNIVYQGTYTGSTAYGTITKGSIPPFKPMPTLDLAYWRERAERGGTLYGDQLPAKGASYGPVKIYGNLTLGTGVNITLDGPVWVTGNILMNENSSVSLKPSFGVYSTVLLADNPYTPATKGKIVINPNAAVNGSGDPKSFILVASTNTSLLNTDPALDVGNNAGGRIFYATEGVVRVRNNAAAAGVARTTALVDQNGSIDYESGNRDLSDIRLSVLPPGTWRIIESTWREISQ